MASTALRPDSQSGIRIWNRELATYPERDARRMHLLLVVLIYLPVAPPKPNWEVHLLRWRPMPADQERFRFHNGWQAPDRRVLEVQAGLRRQSASRVAQAEPRVRTAALDAARSAAHRTVAHVPRWRSE
jgi:hypothetical protein